ncbi:MULTISPECIES: phosphotransferase enzyme family protein [unclassified Variovorax]|uniref:phosphotransferase enzyme family protein n=1 Tax=unclassified Variovorax TaxID=663243 RepID=UPI003F48D86A
MLTPPDLAHESIRQCLSTAYGLNNANAQFLPFGADVNSAAFRVDAHDGTAYFLKLRRDGVDPSVATVPAFLHREKGIEAVMAPLPTTDGRPSVQSLGFDWTLYPFFDGPNGFERALTDTQWRALGAALGAIHRAELPEALSASLPKERYAHHWREGVRRYQRRFINGLNGMNGDDIVERFFAFWEEHAEEIDTIVYRSEQLASILLERPPQLVPCHADLHAGNVLVGDEARLSIVDWRMALLAPKERDLMFIGGGVGHVWNQPAQEALFHEGYGAADIDAVALAYYRYERITRNILEICDQMFDAAASAQDRAEGLRRMKSQFLPDDVVAIAHRSYDAVT